MTLGLFIGRMNPPHIGHLSIIDRVIKENDFVLILIGTQKNRNENNPLDFKQIKSILSKKYLFNTKLKIIELKDDSSDLVWIFSIYKILYENFPGLNDINFYGGDFKNDSAYNVINKNQNHLPNYNINFIENSRKNSFVNYNGQKIAISATNLRQALKNKDYDLVNMLCDKSMVEKIKNTKF